MAKTFASTEHDPLAEADDLGALGVFLKSWDVSDEEVLRNKKLLVSRTFLDVEREHVSVPTAVSLNMVPGEFLPDESLDEGLAAKAKLAKEQQQVWNRGRSKMLGSDHKQTRAAIRARLESGYYISFSGKKKIKVLHRLGQRFMLSRVDFMSYEYAGTTFPEATAYETVCKWCAKSKDFHSEQDSSGTNISSSSEEEK